MLALELILSFFGISLFCWMIFTLTVYALPFFVGLTAGMAALHNGAGIFGALLVGIVVGAFNIARVRELLAVSTPTRKPVETEEPPAQLPPCPCCGGRMRIIETFERWIQPRAPPAATGAPL